MAKESYIEENTEVIEKFTRAIYKAQKWVQEQPADVIAKSIEPFFEDTDFDTIVQVVERYRDQGSYAEVPLLQEEDWYLLQEIMEQSGELPMEIPYEELVNTEIPLKIMNE